MKVNFLDNDCVHRYITAQKIPDRFGCNKKSGGKNMHKQQDILSSATRQKFDDLKYKLSLLRGKITQPIFIVYTDPGNIAKTARLYLDIYLIRVFPEIKKVPKWKKTLFIEYQYIDIGVKIYILNDNNERFIIPYIQRLRP